MPNPCEITIATSYGTTWDSSTRDPRLTGTERPAATTNRMNWVLCRTRTPPSDDRKPAVAKGKDVLAVVHEIAVLRDVPAKKGDAGAATRQHPVVQLDRDDRKLAEHRGRVLEDALFAALDVDLENERRLPVLHETRNRAPLDFAQRSAAAGLAGL